MAAGFVGGYGNVLKIFLSLNLNALEKDAGLSIQTKMDMKKDRLGETDTKKKWLPPGAIPGRTFNNLSEENSTLAPGPQI